MSYTGPLAGSNGKAGKEYVCDCIRHCKGSQKTVSRSTYHRHAPYRKCAFSQSLQLHVYGTVANRNQSSPDRREGVSSGGTQLEELHANSTQFDDWDMVPSAVCYLDAELQRTYYVVRIMTTS
jgi:hypothetical protein